MMRRPTTDQSRLVTWLVASNVATLACVALWQTGAWRSVQRRWRLLLERVDGSRRRSSSGASEPSSPNGLGKLLGRDYVPPLPGPVAFTLNRACLCFLATADGETLSPHLSLMRFTYCKSLTKPGGEVLILSTRRDTLKYQTLIKNSRVALLVHDFSTESDADDRNYEVAVTGGARYSITLNGHVNEETGEIGEKYRAIHLQRNSTYAQFISGDDIAVVTVTLTSARVCDIHDSVRHYQRAAASADSPPTVWKETTR